MDVGEPVELNFFTVLNFQYADKVKPMLFFNMGTEHKKYLKSKGLKRPERDCGFGTCKVVAGGSAEKRIIDLEIKRGKVKNSDIQKKFRSSKLIDSKHIVNLGGEEKHIAPEMKASSGTFSKDSLFKSLKELKEKYNGLHDLDFDERDELLKALEKNVLDWNNKNPEPELGTKKSDSKDVKARRAEVKTLSEFIEIEKADLDGDIAQGVLRELIEDNKLYKAYNEDHSDPSDKHIDLLNDMLYDIDKYEKSDPKLSDSRVRKYLGQMASAKEKIVQERKRVMTSLIGGKAKSMVTALSVKGLKKLEPTAEAEKEVMNKLLEEFNKEREPKLTAKQIMKNKEALEELAVLGFEKEVEEAISYVSGTGTGRDNLAFGFRSNSASTAVTSVMLNATGRGYLNDDIIPLLYDTMSGDNPADPRNDSFTKEFLFTPEEAIAIKATYQSLIDYFKTEGALTKCPDAFKRMGYKAAIAAAKKGAHPNGILVYLGGAIFLRFINPMIAVLGRTQLSHSTYILSEILLRQANQVRFEGSKAKGLDVFNDVLKKNEGVLEDFLLKAAAAGAPSPTTPEIMMQGLYSEQLKSMEVEAEGLSLQIDSFNAGSKDEGEIKDFYKAYQALLSLEDHLDEHYSDNPLYNDLSDSITTGTKPKANRKVVTNLQTITGDMNSYFTSFLTGTKDQTALKDFQTAHGRYDSINRLLKKGLEGEADIVGLDTAIENFQNALAIGKEKLSKIGHSWKTAAQMTDYADFDDAESKLGAKMGNLLFSVPHDIKQEMVLWWADAGGMHSAASDYKMPKPDKLPCWVLFQYSPPFYRLSCIQNVETGAENKILPREMDN